MKTQVAWLGETLSNQAEDQAVAAYKLRRAERAARRERAQDWLIYGLLLAPIVVGLLSLGWTVWRWLG